MDAAAILKPRAAVFHAAYDRWRYSGRADIWLHNSVDTWQKVMDAASRIGMRVAVENVFDETPEPLAMLIEQIDSPDFGFCFDTGHFNLFARAPMEEWFDRLGRHLIEVHLHDNDGTADSHLALGSGAIDFDKFFGLLKKQGADPVYTVEAHDKEDVDVSLERVRAHLKG
jgi:sugar phosphate isomerase/epimerase